MSNCQHVTRLCSEGQERKLSLREKMDIKLHSLICSGCRNYRKQLAFLRLAANRYAQGKGVATELPPDFPSDLE